jgi:hypothetical protein
MPAPLDKGGRRLPDVRLARLPPHTLTSQTLVGSSIPARDAPAMLSRNTGRRQGRPAGAKAVIGSAQGPPDRRPPDRPRERLRRCVAAIFGSSPGTLVASRHQAAPSASRRWRSQPMAPPPCSASRTGPSSHQGHPRAFSSALESAAARGEAARSPQPLRGCALRRFPFAPARVIRSTLCSPIFLTRTGIRFA